MAGVVVSATLLDDVSTCGMSELSNSSGSATRDGDNKLDADECIL